MLRATGGRSGEIAYYHWTCQGCGARWLRIAAGQGAVEAQRPERPTRRQTRSGRWQHITPTGELPTDAEGVPLSTITPPLNTDVMEMSSGSEDP